MPRRLIVPSLRRALAVGALAVVVVATVAMLVALSTVLSMRDEIDRDTNAFLGEQRTADDIVALTYQQELESHRFLADPDSAHRASFRALGDEADAQMRQYLFHDLSPAARLQVERMKETHEQFEVLAQRAFDLAERGEIAAARARFPRLDSMTATLDTAVTGFLRARLAQRAALLAEHRAVAARVRGGLVLIGFALFALAAGLARQLRRQVVVPLEQLTAAAQLIRAGDAHARVPAQHYVELRQVAQAFNEMADSVQLARETVEMQNEELRQSLEQLQDTQEELVQHEKLSAMGQMLAGLAHELNNPLGGVLGLAELLRTELSASSDPEMRHVASSLAVPLEREAIRARDLVRSLLNFARKATGHIEPLPLAATVNTAVGLRAHAFVQTGKTLHVDIPASLHVLVDAQKLQHAILNVVNNALDSIVTGSGTGLTITAAAVGSDVHVHFDDDGPGFLNLKAAFSPFYTTKPADKGTGLGLSLVQKFIEESGGSVAAANRPNGGARVTLRLRRAEPPAAMLEEGAPPASGAGDGAAPAAPDVPDARPTLILVVDDEPSLREVQRRLLMLEGFDVLLAENSTQARELLSRNQVDLVVSDLRMPGDIDGLGLLASLEQDYPELAATALLVTGDVSGTAAGSLPVPDARLIRKPFTRTEYVSRVRVALAQRTG